HGILREPRVAQTWAPPGWVSQRERRRGEAAPSWRPSIHCYPGRRNPQGFRAAQGSPPTPLRLTGLSTSPPRTSAGAVATVFEGEDLKSNPAGGRGSSHNRGSRSLIRGTTSSRPLRWSV